MPAVGRKRAGLALLCPRAEFLPHIGVNRENGPFWAGSRAGRPCLGAAQAVYGPGNWITLDPSRFGARHRSAESWHPRHSTLLLPHHCAALKSTAARQ